MDTAPLFLGWFLISTWSYEFRLIWVGRLAALLITFLLLLFLYRRQEYFREIRQLRFLIRRKRFHKMRRDHHQQLVCRFLNGAALEEISENRNVAEIFHLGELFGHVVIDQPCDGETLAILE